MFAVIQKILTDAFGIHIGSPTSIHKKRIFITKKRVGDTIFVVKRKKKLPKKKVLSDNDLILKQQAKIILTQRLQELSQLHSLSYGRSFIRDQKRKRGSCSRKITRRRGIDGIIQSSDKNDQSILCNISLNRRLSLMPYHIRDYVILHELAHTKHMNHSRDFWKFLEILCPERKVAEQWLKEHGMKYM